MLPVKHLRIQIGRENQEMRHLLAQGLDYQQLVVEIAAKDDGCLYAPVAFIKIDSIVNIFYFLRQSMEVIQLA